MGNRHGEQNRCGRSAGRNAGEELFVRVRRSGEGNSQSGTLGRELLRPAAVGTVQTELRSPELDLEPDQEKQAVANSELQLPNPRLAAQRWTSPVLQEQIVVPVWPVETHTTLGGYSDLQAPCCLPAWERELFFFPQTVP